jgi:hypothetical protein
MQRFWLLERVDMNMKGRFIPGIAALSMLADHRNRPTNGGGI